MKRNIIHFFLVFTAVILFAGCVIQKSSPDPTYPIYRNAIEQPIPDWIGKDYHDIPKIRMLMIIEKKIEDMGNGRKRIEFWDHIGGAIIGYVIKTDSDGVITYATERWYSGY